MNNNNSIPPPILIQRPRRNNAAERRRRRTAFMQRLTELIAPSVQAFHFIDTNIVTAFASSPHHFRAAKVSRIHGAQFWTLTHPNLNDDDGYDSYRWHYRMKKSTLEWLISTLSTHEAFASDSPRMTPAYIQICCAVWRFANTHVGYRMFETQFGLSQGSYHNFTMRFLNAICDVHQQQIRWPRTPEEVRQAAQAFSAPTGLTSTHDAGRRLQGAIGAMDGKLIVIHKPASNGQRFWDRKLHHSINLLAVCTADGRFSYIEAGQSGRTHDARTFANSSLNMKLMNETEQWCPNGTYILADSAYPLRPTIMVPYSRTATNPADKKFNFVHSSMRMAIERAFGCLVSRWRFLRHYLYLKDHERLTLAIYACCILHNICIERHDHHSNELFPLNTEEDEGTTGRITVMGAGHQRGIGDTASLRQQGVAVRDILRDELYEASRGL